MWVSLQSAIKDITSSFDAYDGAAAFCLKYRNAECNNLVFYDRVISRYLFGYVLVGPVL